MPCLIHHLVGFIILLLLNLSLGQPLLSILTWWQWQAEQVQGFNSVWMSGWGVAELGAHNLGKAARTGTLNAQIVVKNRKVSLRKHGSSSLVYCKDRQKLASFDLIARHCTTLPPGSYIYISPTPTFMFFSGSNSELPWKCESILLSAWEVGCEIAHLHLKQQALLSDAQNRPVETGWKWTLVLHPGCIQSCRQDSVERPKMDTHNTFSLTVSILTSKSDRVTAIPHYQSILLLHTLKAQLHHYFYLGFHVTYFSGIHSLRELFLRLQRLGLYASVRREELN